MKKAELEADPTLGKVVGMNVDCGNGHGFCWHCMKDAHEPCECEIWDQWLQEIIRMRKGAVVNRDNIIVSETGHVGAALLLIHNSPSNNYQELY